MDLHKQKRPLGDNKLCKTGSKVDIKNVTFQILSVKACFQVKKNRARLFKKSV